MFVMFFSSHFLFLPYSHCNGIRETAALKHVMMTLAVGYKVWGLLGNVFVMIAQSPLAHSLSVAQRHMWPHYSKQSFKKSGS